MPLPIPQGPLLAWLTRHPKAVPQAIAALNRLESTTKSAKRRQITRPPNYSGNTASGTYTQAELQALMAQVESLTLSQAALVDLLRLVLTELDG